MDIHPEAVKLLNKHRGTDFRPGGEHYVENLTATNAISEALFERDEARDEHKFVLAAESAAIDTLKTERDTLRAQVAAMREAILSRRIYYGGLAKVEDPFAKATFNRWNVLTEGLAALDCLSDDVEHILSTLKDQSNG